MSQTKPLAITLGELAGIGPDVLLQTLHGTQIKQPLVVITDAQFLHERASLLGLATTIEVITLTQLQTLAPNPRAHAYVLHEPLKEKIVLGKPSQVSAGHVLACLDRAVELCLSNHFAAMITAPVQKAVLSSKNRPFTGHTEYIAARIKHYRPELASEPLMMLTTGQQSQLPFRVALATTHHALAAIPKLITKELILEKLIAYEAGLRQAYKIAKPRIKVTGLNPHAGETGQLGLEEIQSIAPAIKAAVAMGLDIAGPFPADTLFTPQNLLQVDGVLAMYHDQGLPVLKFASFGKGINVTLNLPIIRTSVDHGTALSLAGTTAANPGSLIAAIEEAVFMAEPIEN